MTPAHVSLILPANNEAAYIVECLKSVFTSTGINGMAEIIVVANGCTDNTADLARACSVTPGWTVRVVDLEQGGKLNALNVGDAMATGEIRVYLDADVIVSPPLIAQLIDALDAEQPAYASGTPQISHANGAVTRAYARFWSTLPFVVNGVPGFGIFAVNAPGRARWRDFPDIIADDIFVRLQFTPAERTRVTAPYQWPMVEGFANLVRVRRRQNAGVLEIARDYPGLMLNEDKVQVTRLLGRFFHDSLGFIVYGVVTMAVKTPLFRSNGRWARGR